MKKLIVICFLSIISVCFYFYFYNGAYKMSILSNSKKESKKLGLYISDIRYHSFYGNSIFANNLIANNEIYIEYLGNSNIVKDMFNMNPDINLKKVEFRFKPKNESIDTLLFVTNYKNQLYDLDSYLDSNEILNKVGVFYSINIPKKQLDSGYFYYLK